MTANTVETSHDFRAGLGDAFDCTAGTDLPSSVKISVETKQLRVGCCGWHLDGARTVDGITLAQTDEAGPLCTEVTVGIGIKDVSRCRPSVADVTWTQS
jgi:hypothetical protein